MKDKWLWVGVAGALGVLGIVWWQSQKSAAPTGPQNAVDPNAQTLGEGGGSWYGAQGTAPDIGNLLSYNQVPGASVLTPQLTSVDPFSSNYYNPGWTGVYNSTLAGAQP